MSDLQITPHPQYSAYLKRWQAVDDVCDGEPRLKKVDNDNLLKGGVYLRLIDPQDASKENQAANRSFINGAVLYNATSRTLSGLKGMAYRKQPQLPMFDNDLDQLVTNVDGSGLSMAQQSQSVFDAVCKNGRRGLLTDMPRNEDGSMKTMRDVRNGFRPTIKEYSAKNIIDWNESVIDGHKKLTMLVLLEYVECFTGALMLDRDIKHRYLIYRLNEDGVTVQVINEGESGLITDDNIVPVTAANNQKLERIPFSFIGSKNNNPDVDPIPLEPVNCLVLGHYRESANLAESSFSLSAVQPVVADDTYQRSINTPEDSGTPEVSSSRLIVLGSGGKFSFESPPPNTMSQSIQKDYESQMVASGAQLITSNGAEKTAEEAKLNRASEASDLTIINENISNGYTERIKDACLMMGIAYKEEYAFKMNDNFFDSKMSADDRRQLMAEWQSGGISKTVYDEEMKKGKAIGHDVDLDQMNQDINNESGAILD